MESCLTDATDSVGTDLDACGPSNEVAFRPLRRRLYFYICLVKYLVCCRFHQPNTTKFFCNQLYELLSLEELYSHTWTHILLIFYALLVNTEFNSRSETVVWYWWWTRTNCRETFDTAAAAVYSRRVRILRAKGMMSIPLCVLNSRFLSAPWPTRCVVPSVNARNVFVASWACHRYFIRCLWTNG